MATRNSIIRRAFELTGEYAPGVTISAADNLTASEFLNDLVLDYAVDGLHQWQMELVEIPLVASQSSYLIGESGAEDVTNNRPLTVHQAFIRTATGNKDTTLVKLARQEYQELASKGTLARPNQFYYQPTIPDGTLYLFPTPSEAGESVFIDCHVAMDVFTGASSTQDFPPEWTRLLVYGLALELAVVYTIPDTQFQKLALQFARAEERVLAHDSEDASITFSPEKLFK